jgi:transcriptional regulator with XRE-family HTH domain
LTGSGAASAGRLGEFLRARRAALAPDTVGLPASGTRRVPGLRREEVAVLAGVSSDYLTRIEQGRERHPSAQILDALARGLHLDADARRHLFTLAGLIAPAAGHRPRPEVSTDLLRLLDAWPATPAMILDRTMNVLARNAVARAMYSGFTSDDNLLRMTFLDPEGRRFYVDWARAAEASTANLRAALAADPEDSAALELIEELTAGSEEFAALWSAHTVRGKTREAKQFHHPSVGPLTLSYQTFEVTAAPGQQLVVYQAEPGTISAQSLALLGSIAATREPAAHEGERSRTER